MDFARELADVQSVSGLRADVGVSPTTRTLDVWFDNLVTDLSVRRSIRESIEEVERATRSVREALEVTAARAAALAGREQDLVARRDAALAR